MVKLRSTKLIRNIIYKKYFNGSALWQTENFVAIIAGLILSKRLKIRLVKHYPLLTKNSNVSTDVINYTNICSYLLSWGILNA